MMHVLRRELLIDLHTYSCALSWPERVKSFVGRGRPEPLATGSGRGARALEAALSNLGLASETGLRIGSPLRRLGRMTISDEYVDYTIVPASQLRWYTAEEARARAGHYFADLLGHEDSIVACTALPGTHNWLCAAIDPDELETWRDVLASHGVDLRHVHPALVEDLCAQGAGMKDRESVLALPREEGLMLVHLVKGVPQSLQWTSLNPQETAIVDLRLRSFILQTLKQDPWRTEAIIYLVSRSGAWCRYALGVEASTSWSDQRAA